MNQLSMPLFEDTARDYTPIATNVTALATYSTFYLAFKPDNSIYYVSTSANTTLNKAIATGNTIAIRTGDYNGAKLIIPANVSIIVDSSVI